MLQGDIAVKRNRNAVICRGKSCLWPKSKDGTVNVPYTLSDNYSTCYSSDPSHGMADSSDHTSSKFYICIYGSYIRDIYSKPLDSMKANLGLLHMGV